MLTDLVLPYPSVVNIHWQCHGNIYSASERGKHYRRAVALIVHQQRLKLSLPGRLAIKAIVEPPDKHHCDLDNIPKAPLDALAHTGVLVDDEQSDKINVVRGQSVSGERMGVEIYPTMREEQVKK